MPGRKSLTSKILNDMFSPLAMLYIADFTGNIHGLGQKNNAFSLNFNRWVPVQSINNPGVINSTM
jgi:hypothetical protein